MKVKAGKPLLDLVTLAYQADMPILLVGRHGCAKSAILQQSAELLNLEYTCRDLSIVDPLDFSFPLVEDGEVRFVPSNLLPKETGRGGLLVYEEINRASNQVQASCLQLLTARCLNDYKLPKQWLPVASVNPCEEGYCVESLDKALESRFLKVEVEPDLAEWLKWAEANNVHEHVRRFVGATPKIFDAPLSNPRAWTYVSNVLQASSNKVAEDTLLAAIAGIVGDELALAFLRYSETNERPLDADQIIHEYEKHRQTILRWKKNSALDLLNASLHNMKIYLQSISNYNAIATPYERSNIKKFMKDLTGDLRRDAEQFFKEHKYKEILGNG